MEGLNFFHHPTTTSNTPSSTSAIKTGPSTRLQWETANHGIGQLFYFADKIP
jgi:hypothetical protein